MVRAAGELAVGPVDFAERAHELFSALALGAFPDTLTAEQFQGLVCAEAVAPGPTGAAAGVSVR
jgi:hypothetical protein